MGTRGLEIVRFRSRYYIRYRQYDSYFEGLGAEIVASIPTDPDEYQKWLQSMRDSYAAKERALEQHVHEMRDGSEPDYSLFSEFESLPSELPRLNGYDSEYFYITNLDHEVLTMNHSVHWKLDNIPRQAHQWIRAIVDSIYRWKPTISTDICSEENMASLALELPERNQEIGYAFRLVSPKVDITLVEYTDEILRFGREWSPDSFPFRELAFALVSMASNQVEFRSFPAQRCHPHKCSNEWCNSDHLPQSPGWLDGEWVGGKTALLEFGSPSHRAGEPAGASPAQTMYWFQDVLVSLVLVVDGEAITQAVTWGLGQGRANFQIVVLSLFEVTFAEVSCVDGNEPFLKVCQPVRLSPLREKYCLSTHPRERPELKPGMTIQYHRGEILMKTNCTGTGRRLRSHFPGLAALVNFFEVAASRRTPFKSAGILPPELYGRILEFVDYDTWKTCSVVSRDFRSHCLSKYRLDDRMCIVAGPFVRLDKRRVERKERLLSFDFEDTSTGKRIPMMQVPNPLTGRLCKECNWMPVIGGDRKAIMLEVGVQFEPAEGVQVEDDSDDEDS
ncbi:hypothetical protein EDB81DRAFT_888820 [Dactylonectria macrodidyma]|uniref:F-box domain-containing protein n=1 Tax=Dactylonectria macrodidyma TaxID=307937 RepID=A0A9P9E1J4_9HYPO|nr:hypothetical protein EDB81DRAFT_888820 [Dactylonectria macrodidyma]